MVRPMRKKELWMVMILTMLLAAGLLLPAAYAEAQPAGWYLVETKYHPASYDKTVYGGAVYRGGDLYDTYTAEGAEGSMTLSYSRSTGSGTGIAHITWQVNWDTPPPYLAPGQKTGFNIGVKVLSYSAWKSTPGINAHFDSGDIKPGGGTSSYIAIGNYLTATPGNDINTYLESSKVIPEGRAGDKKAIVLFIGFGDSPTGYTYKYEWRAAAPGTPTPAAPAPGSGAEAFEAGARIKWQPAAGLGYRLFRSASQSSLGISVTDFYITSTSYADVNVKPKTDYYYTVKPVLAEANPFQGKEEQLGNTLATFTVKTGDSVYKPDSTKRFILLQLDNPKMSVDGISQEVDPGRGTAPIVITGRTMVPIRAVVEAMGGALEWDDSTQKITLTARGNKVEMWLGQKDIKVNGVGKEMDIAPVARNGRTFVPLRFAAENLVAVVSWLNSTSEAVIVFDE